MSIVLGLEYKFLFIMFMIDLLLVLMNFGKIMFACTGLRISI